MHKFRARRKSERKDLQIRGKVNNVAGVSSTGNCHVNGLGAFTMTSYEYRIEQGSGFPAIIMLEVQLTDKAAVRSARKAAHGRPFEVWRGVDCITGHTVPFPTPGPTGGV